MNKRSAYLPNMITLDVNTFNKKKITKKRPIKSNKKKKVTVFGNKTIHKPKKPIKKIIKRNLPKSKNLLLDGFLLVYI